jgi:hypothetical protein
MTAAVPACEAQTGEDRDVVMATAEIPKRSSKLMAGLRQLTFGPPSRRRTRTAGPRRRSTTATLAGVADAPAPRLITAAELEQMTPDQRAAAFRERVVTNLDDADPALVEWARAKGRELLEARGLLDKPQQ